MTSAPRQLQVLRLLHAHRLMDTQQVHALGFRGRARRRATVASTGGAAARIGAAVLAVPAADVPRYVARIPSGIFVLSQRLDAPASTSMDAGLRIGADAP